MDTTDSFLPLASGLWWQLLGELELSAGSIVDALIHTWLVELLASLNLHNDFLNRILNYAQETTARILRADTEIKLEHIHLLVFASSNRVSKKQTWGFFSVERLENIKAGTPGNEHTIEIYLYVEGEDMPARGKH